VVPSQHPSVSVSPSTSSCASRPGYACGYELVEGVVVANRFAACMFDAKKGKHTSECLDRDQVESTGWLSKSKRFESCGCCPSDVKSFCGGASIGVSCPVEKYGGCAVKGKERRVGVDICYTNKKGKLKKTCEDPFDREFLRGHEFLVGCGPECTSPEGENVAI